MTTDPRVHRLRMAEFNIPVRLRTVTQESAGCGRVETTFVNNFADHLVTANRPLDAMPIDLAKVGRGLAYVGPPGTGKTTRATATILAVYYRYSIPVLFLPYAEYIETLKAAWGSPSDSDLALQAQTINVWARTYPVIVIDDIGKESTDRLGFARDRLDLLLRTRHANGRPTIITTNIPLSKWGETYNPSMGSFVAEAFEPIVLTGKDFRRAER